MTSKEWQNQVLGFVSHETISLPVQQKDQIIKLINDEQQFWEFLAELIIHEKICFPLKSTLTSLNKQELFQNLTQHVPIVSNDPTLLPPLDASLPPSYFTDHQRFLFVTTEKDYHEIDAITDLFTERARMGFSYSDRVKSPLELWRSKPDVQTLLYKEFSGNSNQDITSHSLREALFRQVEECRPFKATLAKATIQKLGGRRVLDFSAGWGDRLIGAIAAKIDRYVAFDAESLSLEECYKDIIETFCSSEEENKSRFTVFHRPIEQADIHNRETFDLVFVSPVEAPHDETDYCWWYKTIIEPLKVLFSAQKKGSHHLNIVLHLSCKQPSKIARLFEFSNLSMQFFFPFLKYAGYLSSVSKSSSAPDSVEWLWIWRLSESQQRVNFQSFRIPNFLKLSLFAVNRSLEHTLREERSTFQEPDKCEQLIVLLHGLFDQDAAFDTVDTLVSVMSRQLRFLWQKFTRDSVDVIVKGFTLRTLRLGEQIFLSEQVVSFFFEVLNFSLECIAQSVQHMYSQERIGYPFKKYHLKVKESELFGNLMQSTPHVPDQSGLDPIRTLPVASDSAFGELAEEHKMQLDFSDYALDRHRFSEFQSIEPDLIRDSSNGQQKFLFRWKAEQSSEKPFSLQLFNPPSSYFFYDLLVDLFQEEVRLRGERRGKGFSPYEFLYSDKENVKEYICLHLEKVMHARRDPKAPPIFDFLAPEGINKEYQDMAALDSLSMREIVFQQRKTSLECGQFKPSLALFFYRLFSAKRILDISAGWGDRLAAAIAHKADRYLAFDPNRDLKFGHDKIIEKLTFLNHCSPLSGSPFQIIYDPCESATIPTDESFDLIFSSPPFFDLEQYSDLPGQSYITFPSVVSWLKGFLFVSLKKCWNVLRDGGRMVLHISDYSNIKICEPMCLFIVSELDASHYLGCVSSKGDSKVPRPIWVFEKNPLVTMAKEKRQKAQSLLDKILLGFEKSPHEQKTHHFRAPNEPRDYRSPTPNEQRNTRSPTPNEPRNYQSRGRYEEADRADRNYNRRRDVNHPYRNDHR